ncbi:Phosphatidylglycerophosphatase A [Thalassocella blandensis]|nr:Phosphatidylglycerophosphatase A [Thalassocella blandensis]
MKLNKVEQPQKVFTDPTNFLAFGLGSGLSPVMPGTVGTLAAVPLYLLMVTTLPWWLYALLTLIGAIVGIYLCGKAADNFNVHDHPGIVWDEFVGFWITMFLVPFSWSWMIVGFVIFRVFDMVKPWPISLADKKVHGGFGIMFDDILAGIAACGTMHILMMFVSGF